MWNVRPMSQEAFGWGSIWSYWWNCIKSTFHRKSVYLLFVVIIVYTYTHYFNAHPSPFLLNILTINGHATVLQLFSTCQNVWHKYILTLVILYQGAELGLKGSKGTMTDRSMGQVQDRTLVHRGREVSGFGVGVKSRTGQNSTLRHST